MSRGLAVGLVFLAACVTEENFPRRAASVSCHRLYECDKALFENTFDDMGECFEETEATYEQLLDLFDLGNCEFSSADAQACLNETRSAPCGGDDAEAPSCSDIYDCS